MVAESKRFERPRTAADLVAADNRRARRGLAIRPAWRWRYPEGFFRVTSRFADAADLLFEDEALVRESSPLFWDPGTPAQVLLWATAPGASWNLSLTRWGVLRWECRAAQAKAADAWVESYASMSCLARVDAPFCAAVVIDRRGAGGKARVRLMAGAVGRPLVQLSEKELDLPAGVERPRTLLVGEGPRGLRPMRGNVTEVLAASTVLHSLYDAGEWRGGTGIDTSRQNASGLVCRLDDATVLAYPGVGLDATVGNYWHHLTVTDPRVRAVRFPICNEMSARFFGSYDHREWFALPGNLISSSGPTGRGLEVPLPRRKGPLHVANCPVYDEERVEDDMAEAARLGAVVRVAARSRGGLPLRVVEFTGHAASLRGKLGVVLLCGQHSPVEQMTGFLGLPFMRELRALHESKGPARGILDRLVFYWVPTFNVDCSRRGLPGQTLDGRNPNRQWFEDLGPEQRGVERFFRAQRRRGVRMAFMIDAHAGLWRNHTVLSDYRVDDERVKTATQFGRPRGRLPFGPADALKQEWFPLLDRHAGLRERWDNGLIAQTPCCAPEWFQETFGSPAITIECSVVTQFDPAARRTGEFAQHAFGDMGRGLARACAAGLALLERGAALGPGAYSGAR